MKRHVLVTLGILLAAAVMTACGNGKAEDVKEEVSEKLPVVEEAKKDAWDAQEDNLDMLKEQADQDSPEGQEELSGDVVSMDGNVIKLNRAVTEVEDDGAMVMAIAADGAGETGDTVTVELEEDAVFSVRQMEDDMIHSQVSDAAREDLEQTDSVTLWGSYREDGTFLANRAEIFRLP